MEPVIVTGMHRSGTSLLTRLLERAGLFVGRDLEENHESRFFIGLNQWILRRAGTTWSAPEPVAALAEDDEAVDAMAAHLRARCRHAGIRRYAGLVRGLRYRDLAAFERPWGWKDPRNTLTLPWWLRAFPEARVVHVERHGVDVAASLVSRYERLRAGMDGGQGSFLRWPKPPQVPRREASGLDSAFDLWRAYNEAAETWLTGAPQVHRVRYEDLLEQPAGRLSEALRFCGLNADAERLVEGIDASRAYAHRWDPALRAFAERRADALRAAGYDD